MNRWVSVALVLVVAMVLGACGTKEPPPPEPKPLRQPAAGEAPVRVMLEFLPPSAPLALGIHSIRGLEEALINVADESELANLPESRAYLAKQIKKFVQANNLPEGSSIADALSNIGIDTSMPAALFLAPQNGRLEMGGVLATKDANQVTQELPNLQKTHKLDVKFKVLEGMVLLASNDQLMQELTIRAGTPAPLAYGTADCPGIAGDSIVVLLQPKAVIASAMLDSGDTPRKAKPLANYIATLADEIVVAADLSGNDSFLRIAMHEAPPAPPEEGSKTPAAAPRPAPPLDALHLSGLFPQGTAAIADIHVIPAFFDFAGAIAQGVVENEKEVKKVLGPAKGIGGTALGNEIAMGLVDVKEGFPVLLLALELKSAQIIPLALSLLGADASNPDFTHKDASVYAINKYVPVETYLATNDKALLVSNDVELLKTAIDGLLADVPAAEAYQAWTQDFGFVTLDGTQLQNLANAVNVAELDNDLDLAGRNLLLRLVQEGKWNEANLAIEHGVMGMVDMLLPQLVPEARRLSRISDSEAKTIDAAESAPEESSETEPAEGSAAKPAETAVESLEEATGATDSVPAAVAPPVESGSEEKGEG